MNGAVLLFKGDSPEVAEKFAREDPYVTNGAVKRWYVREWTTVAGEDALTPIRPKAVAASKEVLSDFPKSIQTEKGPVLRLWKGRSTVERASEYVLHATKKVFPALRAIEGHRGAYLLRRMVDGAIEFVVLTLWDSMATARRFAGAEPEKAVVDAEARAILTSFDERVTHYEIVRNWSWHKMSTPRGPDNSVWSDGNPKAGNRRDLQVGKEQSRRDVKLRPFES